MKRQTQRKIDYGKSPELMAIKLKYCMKFVTNFKSEDCMFYHMLSLYFRKKELSYTKGGLEGMVAPRRVCSPYETLCIYWRQARHEKKSRLYLLRVRICLCFK